MLRWKSLVVAMIATVLGGLCFVFVIYGGLDKFKDPIQIVVPNSVNGILCIRLASNSALGTSTAEMNYLVQENGRLEMDEVLLRSHRKKQFFRTANATSPMVKIPDDEWFPILTENDSKNDVAYAVYWLGTKESWITFSEKNRDIPLCLSK